MAISGTMTAMVARTAKPPTRPLLMRRLKTLTREARSGGRMDWLAISGHPCWRAARHHPYQQARACIHHDGDQEECESDLDQSAQVHIAGGFAELVGEDTGHGVARGQEGLHYLRAVANHHGDRHGLAEGAAQAEDDGAHDTDARVAE